MAPVCAGRVLLLRPRRACASIHDHAPEATSQSER